MKNKMLFISIFLLLNVVFGLNNVVSVNCVCYSTEECNKFIKDNKCENILLDSDINGTIIFNGTSNKILEGFGHKINSNIGIVFDGNNKNITLKNLIINSSKSGIVFDQDSNNEYIKIENCTIKNTKIGGDYSFGIKILGDTRIKITNSTIDSRTQCLNIFKSGDDAYSIYVESQGTIVTIENSKILSNSHETRSYDIFVSTDHVHLYIFKSILESTTDKYYHEPINVKINGDSNTILIFDSKLRSKSSNADSYNIIVDGNNADLLISNSELKAQTHLGSNSKNIELKGNNINVTIDSCTLETSSNEDLSSSIYDNIQFSKIIIYNSKIKSHACDEEVYGVNIFGDNNIIKIWNTSISTNSGLSITYGIKIDCDKSQIDIQNSIIEPYSDSSESYGIYISGNLNKINIKNNHINTVVAGVNSYGIYLDLKNSGAKVEYNKIVSKSENKYGSNGKTFAIFINSSNCNVNIFSNDIKSLEDPGAYYLKFYNFGIYVESYDLSN